MPSLTDTEELDLKKQRGVGRDVPGGKATSAVRIVARHQQLSRLTHLHLKDPFVPTLDNMSDANDKGEGLAVIESGPKLLPVVGEVPRAVDGHCVLWLRCGTCAGNLDGPDDAHETARTLLFVRRSV